MDLHPLLREEPPPDFDRATQLAIADAFDEYGDALSVSNELDLPYKGVYWVLFNAQSPIVAERIRRMRESETAVVDEFMTNLVFSLAELRAKMSDPEGSEAGRITAAGKLGDLSMKGLEFVAKHGRRAADAWQQKQREVDAMSYGELADKLGAQADRYRALAAATGAPKPLGPGGVQ